MPEYLLKRVLLMVPTLFLVTILVFLMMRLIPVLTTMSLLGPGLLNVTAVLGLSFGIQNSRIIRGAALS
jgi:ABC-type dipeptide/oligopeptide/nickel transport system permease component